MWPSSWVWSTFRHIRKEEHHNRWAVLSGISPIVERGVYKRRGSRQGDLRSSERGRRGAVVVSELFSRADVERKCHFKRLWKSGWDIWICDSLKKPFHSQNKDTSISTRHQMKQLIKRISKKHSWLVPEAAAGLTFGQSVKGFFSYYTSRPSYWWKWLILETSLQKFPYHSVSVSVGVAVCLTPAPWIQNRLSCDFIKKKCRSCRFNQV